MPTMKEIADLAGVSRGTVDRALNKRGDIKPETRRQILRIAQELGYTRNKAGTALAAKRKSVRFGVIIPETDNDFFAGVSEGIHSIEKEYADYGLKLTIRRIAEFSVDDELACIEELIASGVSGLALVPFDDDKIREKIQELSDKEFPVVTLNSEIEGCHSLCYVGCDYLSGGRTVAGLTHLIFGRKRINMIVLVGSLKLLGHAQRIEGFQEEARSLQLDTNIIGIYETNTDNFIAYDIVCKAIAAHPELDFIYCSSGGAIGACKALNHLGMCGKIKLITFGMYPKFIPFIQNGTISATISQDPLKQGSLPIRILFDAVVNGVLPAKDKVYIKNEIMILQNLSDTL